MNEGLKQFEDLFKNDSSFREELQELLNNYTGEPNEEAVFNSVLIPFAKKHNISATFEEYKEYTRGLMNTPLSEEEMEQVAGGYGKGKGYGAVACSGVGLGLGGGGGNGTGGACLFLGGGWGGDACFHEGETVGLFD